MRRLNKTFLSLSLCYCVFAGKGDGAKQHQLDEGPAGGDGGLPAAARGPAPQGHPAARPARPHAHARPRQAHQPQHGAVPPLHAGEDIGVAAQPSTGWTEAHQSVVLLFRGLGFTASRYCVIGGCVRHTV